MTVTMLTGLLTGLLGCNQETNAPPPQISGLWQVHQVETGSGEIDGQAVALRQFPGCSWARQTWRFEGDRLVVEHDVLCPSSVENEFVGCSVAAEVPATWEPTAGKWVVPASVRAKSRAVGLEAGALALPTACTVEVDAGDYPVLRMRGQDWRWEVGLPNGTVLRLRIPESDEPDFVMAMRQAKQEQAP